MATTILYYTNFIKFFYNAPRRRAHAKRRARKSSLDSAAAVLSKYIVVVPLTVVSLLSLASALLSAGIAVVAVVVETLVEVVVIGLAHTPLHSSMISKISLCVTSPVQSAAAAFAAGPQMVYAFTPCKFTAIYL